MDDTRIVVIGSLNTDIIASGLTRLPGPGELVTGKQAIIGPGGKSRNIAAMASTLMPTNEVAMVARTAEDSFGLWKPPYDALRAAGVNTDFVQISHDGAAGLPALALIPVTDEGDNQIILLPGASNGFSPADIDTAEPVFDAAAKNNGMLVATLECPLETVRYALGQAAAIGLKTVLDPGGVQATSDTDGMLEGLYLLKPNEHEAAVITGITVNDFSTAQLAAGWLQERGVKNVLITHGDKGAYLFEGDQATHIPVPVVAGASERDATGCGDQAMAALCTGLEVGKTLAEAAKLAVLCGTLQFHKTGVQPLTKPEIDSQL